MTDKRELIDEALNPDNDMYCGRCAKFAKHIGNEGDSGDLYVVTSYQNFKKFFTEWVTDSRSETEYLYGRDADIEEIFNVPFKEMSFYQLCELLMLADKKPTTASAICTVIESILGIPTTLTFEDTGCLEICFSKANPYWVYRVKFQNLREYFAEFWADRESTYSETNFFRRIFGKKEVRDEKLDEIYTKIRWGLERMSNALKLNLTNFYGDLNDCNFDSDNLLDISDFLSIAEICISAFETARYGGKRWQNREVEHIKKCWERSDSIMHHQETTDKETGKEEHNEHL